jgi:hypothetical protein
LKRFSIHTWGLINLSSRKEITSDFAQAGLPNPAVTAGYGNPAGAEVIVLQVLSSGIGDESK